MIDRKKIDLTNLSPNLTENELEHFLTEAIQYNPYAVCLSPDKVLYAYRFLKDTDIKVCTVIGFPNGNHDYIIKAIEATKAIQNGAEEIDYVINRSLLLSTNIEELIDEAQCLRHSVGKRIVIKAILETSELSIEQIAEACVALYGIVDFVKTSSGFSKKGGATVEAIQLMKRYFHNVKASGGVKTIDDYWTMIAAGATRIGTSQLIGYGDR